MKGSGGTTGLTLGLPQHVEGIPAIVSASGRVGVIVRTGGRKLHGGENRTGIILIELTGEVSVAIRRTQRQRDIGILSACARQCGKQRCQ